MADAPTPPSGYALENSPTPPSGYEVEKPEEGSSIIKAAGQAASFLPRAGRALGVGVETAMENTPPGNLRSKLIDTITNPDISGPAIEAGREAFKPGFKPKPGQKIGAALGSIAGAVPEIALASELAPTFLPEVPALAPLARVALARAAHSAVVFGAQSGFDTTAEQAALTGKVDPMQSLKAASGGAFVGAGLGAAGAVPALVSGQLPEAVTKVLSDEIASRLFGASVAGAVGAGASAAGGGTKEEVAAHGAGFFLMDILGNGNFDEAYKQAAKDSAIKPLVDSMIDSGMQPQDAIVQARGMLENVLKETGHASQVIRNSPQYQEAVKYMAGEYLKANPGMDPVGAEALARRRIDVAFANGELSIAQLKKLKLSMAPESTQEAAGATSEAPGPAALPAPETPQEGPAASEPQALTPSAGHRVDIPAENGSAEGIVMGFDPQSGAPIVHVDAAHGANPPAAVGDVESFPPEALRFQPGDEHPTRSPLVNGPATTMARLTPEEFTQRFPDVDPKLYEQAMIAVAKQGVELPPGLGNRFPAVREAAIQADLEGITKARTELVKKEDEAPEMFGHVSAIESWPPERLKAALDAADIRAGSAITSRGFMEPDLGRVKRGEAGKVLGIDLEHGKILAQFGDRVVIADPRDLAQTALADKDLQENPKKLSTKSVVEANTGVDPVEKMLHMAESEVLRIKLLNQQNGSIVAAQSVRREMLGQFTQQIRAGKDIRKTLAMFTRQALTDLKVNNVTVGKLLNIIAKAKNDQDFTQGLLTIEDTINTAYSKELIGEIKQIWDRSQGAPGVEVGWQKRMQSARADISFTAPSAEKVERALAAAEFIAQAAQAGVGGQVNPGVRQFSEETLRRPLVTLSVPELEELRDQMLSLEKTGRQAQAFKEQAHMYRRARLIAQMTGSGQPIEQSSTTPRRPGEGPLPIQIRIRNSIGTETDFWQDKGRAIMAPHVMFDMADGNRGYIGGHSSELAALNGAYHDAAQFAHRILKPIHNLIERLKITPEEYEKTAIALIRNQAGGMEHLLGDRWLGVNEAERARYIKSISLDARQKALGAELLKIGNDQAIFQAIAEDIRVRQNREVKKVDNWYPFVNNYSRFGDMPLNERLGDAFENRFARKEVAHGYTIERQAGAKSALRYDLAAFEKIVQDIAYQVKAGSTMQLFSEAVNSQQYERAMGPFWTRWMRQYATLMASRGGTQGARRSEMIQKITRNIATYALGWRIASAFSHVGLLPLAANEIGWGPVNWGLQNYGSPKYDKFLRENIPEFRESTKGAEMLEAIRTSNQPANARGTAFNVYDSARRMFAGSAALGAYKHWFDQRGLKPDWNQPNRDALLYAAQIMTRTQGSPLYKDVPLALSSGGFSGNVDLDRALLQFHQPILARWSYFQHDIKHLGWDAGDKTAAAGKLMNLMLGETLEFGVKYAWKGIVGAIITSLFGVAYASRKDSLKEEGIRFAEHILATIPFMDNLMSMGLHQRTGIPALDAIQSIPHGIVTAVKAIEGQHHATALHATVEALGGIASIAAGAPGGSIVSELAHKGITASVNAGKSPAIPHPPRIHIPKR